MKRIGKWLGGFYELGVVDNIMNRINVMRVVMMTGLLGFGGWALPVSAMTGYQNQIVYYNQGFKYENNDKQSSNLVVAERYVYPLSSEGLPRQEAAFLTRAGSYGVLYGNSDYKHSLDTSTTDKGIKINLAESGKAWVIQGFYLTQGGSQSSPVQADITLETTKIGLGYYLSNGALLYVTQENDKSKIGSTKTKRSRIEYAMKWVTLLSQQTAFNFEMSVTNDRQENAKTERGQYIEVSGDYYFTPDASIGLLYSKISHDLKELEGSHRGIRANYFVTPSFFIGVGVDRFHAAHSSGIDDERQDLSVGYRF